jgi:DNA-binding ferritin-like protein
MWYACQVEQNLGTLETGIQLAQSKEDEDTKRFAKEIAEEVPKLNRALQATREALEKPRLADLDADVAATVELVEKLDAQFKATEEKCKKMARYQEVLGLQADEYVALEEVASLMGMQLSLWTASRDFSKLTAQWKELPVGAVSSDDLEKVLLTQKARNRGRPPP